MWQLRGQRGCYGVYMELTGRLSRTSRYCHLNPVTATMFFSHVPGSIALRGSYGTALCEDVTAALYMLNSMPHA